MAVAGSILTLTTDAPDILGAVARLRDLPASAPVVQRALAELECLEFVVARLNQILLSDAAVSARILRLANSAYFGFCTEVHTVSQAIVLLGQSRIRTLLRRLLADKLLLELGQARSAAAPLRRMSLATATACCTLSQLLSREDPEELLLAGLLHNLGELFLLSQFPAEFWHAAELAGTLGWQEAAVVVFGMTAGQAAKLLLSAWHFPLLYRVVVEHIDHPFAEQCPPELSFSLALAHIGKNLAESFAGGVDAAEAVLRIPQHLYDRLGLDAELLAAAYRHIPQRMSIEQLQAGRE